MRIYADHPARRSGQVIADVFGLASIVGGILAGVALNSSISGLVEPAQEMERTGASFEDSFAGAADTLGRLPVVGDDVSDPFTQLAGAAAGIRAGGAASAVFAERTAAIVGVLTPTLVLVLAVVLWLRPRLLWLRDADDARAVLPLPQGPDLLAARAATRVRLARLAAHGDDLIRRWRDGDDGATYELARAELDRLGLDYRELSGPPPPPGHGASTGRNAS